MIKASFTGKYLCAPAQFQDASYFSQLYPGSTCVCVNIPQYDMVLSYEPDDEGLQHIFEILLSRLELIKDYNKLLICCKDNRTYVTFATGEKLLLVNSFSTGDSVSILYYLLLALQQSQVNPQQTIVHCLGFREKVDEKLILSYFKDFVFATV